MRSYRFRHRRHSSPRPGPQKGDGRASGATATLHRKTILVVEDSATFGGLLAALLREEGYQSMRAWNAREAAKMARDRRPNLVVVDLSLPYTERAELLEALRANEETSDKPFIVVSSHPLPFLSEGEQISSIVNKPYDIDKLLNCVRRALGEPELAVPEKHYEQQDSYLHGW